MTDTAGRMFGEGRAGRFGLLFAAVWLVFLADTFREAWRVAWSDRHALAGWVGLVSLAAFAACYLATFSWVRRRRQQMHTSLPRGRAVLVLLVLLGLVCVTTAALGQSGTSGLVFVAVVAVMVLPTRGALAVVVGLALAVEVSARTVPGWREQGGLTFAICTAAFAMWGVRQLMLRNVELLSAREENARLAVEDERNRLARDLHDILGHSLTVITVKAELANRLLDVDPARARRELADLERLSRDALADVRRAVDGYREITLPGELARAREALVAAAIDAELPNSTDEVPSELRDLFAWAVREGVTNVIRHSRASRCMVTLGPGTVAVVDDGPGPEVARAAGPRAGRAAGARRGGRGRGGHPPGGTAGLRAGGGRRMSGPIRLLIADDQALVRGALAALLDLEPDLTVVAEVASGDAVVDAAREHRPDVALLDVEMPGMDGIEATAALRSAVPTTRVLIVTTFGRPGFLRRALRAGAAGFVVKDTPARQLADAVRRVHAGLRVVDPGLAADSLVAGESPLTARETDVLRAARGGGSAATIAARLYLSEGTVRNHLSSAIGKTGSANRAEAVRVAETNGWL